ncbi:MAG: TonB-dependent receptor, partial [Terriglobales bacterium]
HRDPRESSFSGTNLLVSYDFDWATLLSSTNRITKDASGFTHAERGLALGLVTSIPDPNAPPDCVSSCDLGFEDFDQLQVVNVFNLELRAYTQELRLISPDDPGSDWEWLAGGSYLDYQQDLFSQGSLPFTSANTGLPPQLEQALNGLPIFPLPTPVGPVLGTRELQFLVRRFENQATETALFGEVTRRLGEHWEFTAGGRAFRTEYAGDHLIAGIQSTAFTFRTEETVHAEIEEEGINPKYSIRYKHDQNLQVYVLAAKGFQFGGIQVNPPTLALGAIADQSSGGQGDEGFGFVPYKSSKLWNYELGLRTEWLDNRLRFDMVFFYLDWKDLQLQQPVNLESPMTIPGVPVNVLPLFTVIGNVGAAHSEGVELAVEVVPFPGVSFTTSAAWINALTDVEYIDGNANVIPPGTRLPGSPRFQWANVLNVGGPLPFFPNWEGGFSLAHAHTGDAFSDLLGENPIGDYDTLDAG